MKLVVQSIQGYKPYDESRIDCAKFEQIREG